MGPELGDMHKELAMREHTIGPPNTGSPSLNVITALTVGAARGSPNLATDSVSAVSNNR
jgi:hypothetical protein